MSGGDLDNRIKTLFDALRMPHHENELGGATPADSDSRCYCLMEDDSLVTRVSITTSHNLEPMLDDESESDVDLSIKVTVEASYPMLGNWAFPVA